MDPGYGLRICISSKLPGDAGVGPWTQFELHGHNLFLIYHFLQSDDPTTSSGVILCLPVKFCCLLISLTCPSPKIRKEMAKVTLLSSWSGFIPYSEGPVAWMPFWIGRLIMGNEKFYLCQNI